MNYLQQKLFCLLLHSHHVGILVVQQAHGVLCYWDLTDDLQPKAMPVPQLAQVSIFKNQRPGASVAMG